MYTYVTKYTLDNSVIPFVQDIIIWLSFIAIFRGRARRPLSSASSNVVSSPLACTKPRISTDVRRTFCSFATVARDVSPWLCVRASLLAFLCSWARALTVGLCHFVDDATGFARLLCVAVCAAFSLLAVPAFLGRWRLLDSQTFSSGFELFATVLIFFLWDITVRLFWTSLIALLFLKIR